jgi:hypothetical protein
MLFGGHWFDFLVIRCIIKMASSLDRWWSLGWVLHQATDPCCVWETTTCSRLRVPSWAAYSSKQFLANKLGLYSTLICFSNSSIWLRGLFIWSWRRCGKFSAYEKKSVLLLCCVTSVRLHDAAPVIISQLATLGLLTEIYNVKWRCLTYYYFSIAPTIVEIISTNDSAQGIITGYGARMIHDSMIVYSIYCSQYIAILLAPNFQQYFTLATYCGVNNTHTIQYNTQ